MSFPPAFLDELRTRLPLSSVVGKRMRLIRAGREFKGCCPFHKEKTPSFYVNDEKQFYHCFGCGAHGDIIGFSMRHDGLSFPEAIDALAAEAGLSVPQDTPQERAFYDKEKRLLQLLERTNVWFEEQLFLPSGREALAYLRKRGLTDGAIERFRLGYAPNNGQAFIQKMTEEGYTLDELMSVGLAKKHDDRDAFSFFRNRVMFPIGDRKGRTIAFGGRVMDDSEPKYLNSPDHPLFHKGALLYGLSRARGAVFQGQPLVVVEGYMDVIAMVEAGFQGAVAPLGTALTEDQLGILWKLLPPPESRNPSQDYSPILCFDGDSAGIRAATRGVDRALPLLTANQTARVAYLPAGEDPDSLIRRSGKSAVQSVLDQAKSMIDIVWETTIAGRRLQTPEERATFIASIKKRIGVIQDENLRHLYQQETQKRIRDLFQPAQQSSSSNWKKGRYPAAQPVLQRRQPQSPARLMEKALLAVVINHSDLFDELSDDLARMSFVSPDLEALRQRLIDLFSAESAPLLSPEELYREIQAQDPDKICAKALTETLSESTYMLAGFARPNRSPDEARHGWKSIRNKKLREELQADLNHARQHYAEEESEANLSRLLAIRAQIVALTHESSESEETDAIPSSFV